MTMKQNIEWRHMLHLDFLVFCLQEIFVLFAILWHLCEVYFKAKSDDLKKVAVCLLCKAHALHLDDD